MTAVQFAYWLQGFFEMSEDDSADTLDDGLARGQVDCIRKHLALVFVHDIDPKAGGKLVQETLNKIHHGPFPPPKSPVSLDGDKTYPCPTIDNGPTFYRC